MSGKIRDMLFAMTSLPNLLRLFLVFPTLFSRFASAYTVDLRTVFCGAAATFLTAPSLANASPSTLESVYIGCGCFWHLQHSVAVFERDELGRKGGDLTCKTGYAGGARASDRACYHNSEGAPDYGVLGHGEVVGVDVPGDRILDLMQMYFDNFDLQTKDRRDPMDVGPEYRSIIGVKGGSSHPLYSSIKKLARRNGYKLLPGKGSDADTLGKQLIYVYSTEDFPFFQAEIYHQFHTDFQSLPYGTQYNNLADRAYKDGRLKGTGCPDRLPTI